ncbi:hypothetical protein NUW58_g4627 [Xylaria curta]|uniref:Uncharacterized protein n=1 Tax=Xylaria curta TaxID=42375 RepID=A0ACC1P8A4_9PEZI|nr:hypothetical protein NUW58_g4627 [Xylaria curta]
MLASRYFLLILTGPSVSALAELRKDSRSVGVPRSRQHLLEVREQKRVLKHKLRKAEHEIGLLSGIRAQGVRHLRDETVHLIRHSRQQIKQFEAFYDRFTESRTVRSWNYIAISAGSDKILEYAKRFETYSDWITIARLSISLTSMSERASRDVTSVSFSCRRDVNRLRDELDRVKRVKQAHPGRLKKLHVNKGVNLEKLEKYANGLVLMFDASDTGTVSSIAIIDDLPEVYAPYRAVSGTRERYYGRATQVTTFADDSRIYVIPRAPPNIYTSVTREKRDTSRSRDDWRSNHGRGRSRTAMMHPESSGSRRSVTPDSGYDDDDDATWNTAPISQKGRRPRERRRYNISSDRTYAMTSGLGRLESPGRRQHSPSSRQSGSRSNETHTQLRSHQSYHSEPGSDQEVRGRDKHRPQFQDARQNSSSPLRHQPQLRSSQYYSQANARQGKQRREKVANIETRPSTSRHSSRSRSATLSSMPSPDSGYASIYNGQNSSSASIASTPRRSSSRQRLGQKSQSNGVDRSKPPITLDRAEEGIRKAQQRIRGETRGAR